MKTRLAFHAVGLSAAVLVAGAVALGSGTSVATAAPITSHAHCALSGNHICGPGAPGNPVAGCYTKGVLVIPWLNTSNPRQDRLWGRGYVNGRYQTCAEILASQA